MSKIGKLPIDILEKVEVTFSDRMVTVKGPKGELQKKLPIQLDLNISDKQVVVIAQKNTKTARALHGTYRALIFNMVKGVSEGWTKTLEMVGTGYRSSVSGDLLTLTVGFSHPVEIKAPDGISFKVEKSFITIEGIDKELVGKIAAEIRMVRPPEPYKGKGIKYQDEVVRRKPGKAAKAAAA